MSGTKLPSNAYITSITFTLYITAGGYSSTKNWQLLWFAIGGTSGSPKAGTQSYAMSSTKNTFSGSMSYTQSDVSKFTGGSFTLYAKANSTHSSTSYMREVTITINYQLPSITAPSGLKINSTTTYTGQTAPLTWTAATINYGSGTITYSIRKNGTQVATTTSVSYTFAESVTQTWGTAAVTITIVATGAGLTSSASNSVTYTYRPLLTGASTLKVNGVTSSQAQTAALTWTAGKLSNGGAVTYSIRINGTQLATTTNTSYTVAEATALNYVTAVTITIVTTGAGLTSAASNAVTFTYLSPNKTVGYYTGSAWVNTIPYYWNGTAWAKCELYYYNGSAWVLCSTT